MLFELRSKRVNSFKSTETVFESNLNPCHVCVFFSFITIFPFVLSSMFRGGQEARRETNSEGSKYHDGGRRSGVQLALPSSAGAPQECRRVAVFWLQCEGSWWHVPLQGKAVVQLLDAGFAYRFDLLIYAVIRRLSFFWNRASAQNAADFQNRYLVPRGNQRSSFTLFQIFWLAAFHNSQSKRLL